MSTSTPRPVESSDDVSQNLRKSLLKGLIIPVLMLVFFWLAPKWLDARVHDSIYADIEGSRELSPDEKARRKAFFEQVDFASLTWSAPEELADLRQSLDEAGILGQFQRLGWSFRLSALLVGVLLAAMVATYWLNARAQRSRDELIRAYRLAWRVSLGAALTKVFLLIPLLSYGLFELTTLAFDRYFPKIILAVLIGGLIVLWRATAILVRRVPLEFTENFAREVTPTDAPALWRAVRDAAARLQTAPPDRILVGMQHNFYVTELAVIHDGGRVEGRTLFLSQPMMKQLATDEVLAIVGHELGHFIGDDTRITREFYPLRFKIQATFFALAESGWVGWPSLHALNFFSWSFGSSEQSLSRQREFEADRIAARLTSPETAARALVRFHVINEAYEMGIAGADGGRLENPYDVPLTGFIRERLLPRDTFWMQLFEKKSPHPLDSHPPLRDRLESLGRPMDSEEAKRLALLERGSAYAVWFEGREELFGEITAKAEAVVTKLRSQIDVSNASYDSPEGRLLLDTHFPELIWRRRAVSFWIMIALWALGGALLALLGAVVAEGIGYALLFYVPAALMFAGLACTWKRHHHGAYILRADSLNYTGWQRPLMFADVRDISVLNQNGNFTVTFHLKTGAPSIWVCSPLNYRRKSVSVGIAAIQGKQQENTETLFNYFTRRIPAAES